MEELTASGILEICKGLIATTSPALANDAPGEKAALLRIGCIMKKTFKENGVHRGAMGFEMHKDEDVRYSEERRREVTMNKYAIRRTVCA